MNSLQLHSNPSSSQSTVTYYTFEPTEEWISNWVSQNWNSSKTEGWIKNMFFFRSQEWRFVKINVKKFCLLFGCSISAEVTRFCKTNFGYWWRIWAWKTETFFHRVLQRTLGLNIHCLWTFRFWSEDRFRQNRVFPRSSRSKLSVCNDWHFA